MLQLTIKQYKSYIRAEYIGMDKKKIQELVELGDDYFLKQQFNTWAM